MNTKNQEIEVKFLISAPTEFELRLQHLGARLLQPRVKEINYRLDTLDKKLSASSKVLRLRQDSTQWITFKGPGALVDGIKVRQEIEFEIGDIQAARYLLEALGYDVYQVYEKIRTVFALGDTRIMLDELPYGHFVEIEGPNTASVFSCSNNLDLVWDRKIDISYLEIYKRICNSMGTSFSDLLFAQFSGKEFFFEHLNIHPADL